MRGQVKSDMPVIMRGVVELAVTGLTQVQRPPVVQLLAVGMVAYLGSPAFVHAGWVLAAQSLLLCRALVFCGEAEGISLGMGVAPTFPWALVSSRSGDPWGRLLTPAFKGSQCPFLF